jgi:hypothetical protein
MSSAVLDSLLADLPVGFSSLPGWKFFEPKPAFIEAMQKYKHLEIWDIGAGVGHVSALLTRVGFNTVAIDLNAREKCETTVVVANSVRSHYPPNAMLLFCRPCHNGFVEATIRQGLRCGVSCFGYVSLEQNRSNDLGEFEQDFDLISRNVGKDRESLYVRSDPA